MLPEVAVLYDDSTVQRVPWADKKDLPRDNVFAVAICHKDEKSRRKRNQVVSEHDFYVLVWTDTDCCLIGYDDSDYYFFSLTKPWLPYGEGFRDRFPYLLPSNSILFISGDQIDGEVWKERFVPVISDRDGPMG